MREPLVNPHLLPKELYCRTPKVGGPPTKQRLTKQQKEEGSFVAAALDFDQDKDGDSGSAESGKVKTLPCPPAPTNKNLGVTIDSLLALNEHYRNIMAKAPVRQGVLNRAARSHWGLEVGVLRMTHDAINRSALVYSDMHL